MTALERIEHLNMALLELDELIVLITAEDADVIERELWMARARNARRHISMTIRDEMSTAVTIQPTDELKGYDC